MESEKKKRGRKPKGGKIIKNDKSLEKKQDNVLHSVILHLKCNMKENNKKSFFNNEFNDENYHYIKGINNNKNINDKIDNLNLNFNNNITNTTSCCFWCTEKFNNSPYFIPKTLLNNNIEVYGHFCSPECCAGYLFNEKIDTSTKWERYSFLNNIYNKNYDKKILPSPAPHYILDKFYGNLSIDEYREINAFNELVVINKPITKITPEIHITNKNKNINSI